MSVESFVPEHGVRLSDTAKKHIETVIAQSGKAQVFRLYLETSGCSGFMYETELVDSPADNDESFEENGVTVCVPRKDLPMLNGTEIDFITVGLNSMFQFKNPNVTGECGCGESFSITPDDEEE